MSKEYKNECKDIIDKDYPIWIFWEQGIEQAPEVVKICVNSIIEHNPERKVNIISRDNLEDYIELPDYIVEKHKCGKISYAHFSDIVRFALLYTWGGMDGCNTVSVWPTELWKPQNRRLYFVYE